MEKWYVLQVRAGYEKKVVESLRKQGMQVYCPLVREVRIWSDRKKTVEVPLIKSYVFLKCTEKERNRAFAVPGVLRYLFWLGRPAVVREGEMKVLKEWVEEDKVDDVAYAKWKPGTKTVIEKGPLKGRDAVVRYIGGNKVSLVLEDLGLVVTAKLKEFV
ncbi:UpxY family transcription antiterminator [Pseudozobellia thermophila]|uniref:Transcription antitermination factor NusG n=1 Tax=Pseudozobellia thermophila TaxID=192903 RepID=A0A1M6KQH4_9FLAO|nr:UpxY family transcription antiterminator [Pseudozobellia thermophila]SHJ61156.1 Transcription antitermination factor NusG [Pseudozobellia thermophila]